MLVSISIGGDDHSLPDSKGEFGQILRRFDVAFLRFSRQGEEVHVSPQLLSPLFEWVFVPRLFEYGKIGLLKTSKMWYWAIVNSSRVLLSQYVCNSADAECIPVFLFRIPKDTYYDVHQEEADLSQERSLKEKPKSGKHVMWCDVVWCGVV